MTKEDLELWYENNRDGMLRYAMSLVHNSVDIGCDIVSESLIVLMQRYQYIENEEEYRKLLCRIILNKAMNLRRKKKEINLDDPIIQEDKQSAGTENEVIAIDIKQAMEKLPAMDKEALEVSLGYRQKADDITLEKFSKRAERARKKLKKIIAPI